MNLLNTYKLQKRLEKLESILRIFNEDEITDINNTARTQRARKSKANIFSRKLDSVLAAIDEGQDINQVNSKGQTPLLAMTAATPIEVVKCLLDNGADLNLTYKDKDAFELASKNNREDIASLILSDSNFKPKYNILQTYYNLSRHTATDTSFISLAASKESGEFSFDLYLPYYYTFNSGVLTKEQYKNVMTTVVNNCSSFKDDTSEYNKYLVSELDKDAPVTICCIADRFKLFVKLYDQNVNLKSLPHDSQLALIDLCKRCIEGDIQLTRGDVYDAISMCSTLCDLVGYDYNPYEAVYDPSTIKKLSEKNLYHLMNAAIRGNREDRLKQMIAARAKISLCTAKTYLSNNKNLDRKWVQLIVQLIDLPKGRTDATTLQCIYESIFSHYDDYIEFLIDRGYGDRLAYYCADRRKGKPGGIDRDTRDCAVVLVRNGYDLNKDYNYAVDDEVNPNNVNAVAKAIVRAIKYDSIDSNLIKSIEKYPAALGSDIVTDAIANAGDNNAISRQIQRMKDRLYSDDLDNDSGDDNVYDF